MKLFLRAYRMLRRRQRYGEKPHRDWYDGLTLLFGVIGLAVVGATLIHTLKNDSDNDRDTAAAIGAMENIAVEMRNDRPLLKKQTDAAENAAGSAEAAASASKRQAIAAATSADANTRALQQESRFNAAQLRPVFTFNMDSEHMTAPQTRGDETRWNYAYVNTGQSTAFGAEYYEGISINGSDFQESKRTGREEISVGQGGWSTATFFASAAKGAGWPEPLPALRVRFHFKDAVGNWYWSLVCLRIAPNGANWDCSAEFDASTGRKKKGAWNFVRR